MTKGDNNMKRDQIADMLKGYACFLVLFGHVTMGIRKCGAVNVPEMCIVLEQVIWSFHVALFMFVSGYVYQYGGGWKRKGSRIRFLRNKIINLAIPYFIFSVVYIVLNSCISSTNSDFHLRNILFLHISPVAQYWFLYALVFVFVIYILLNIIIKKPHLIAILSVIAFLIVRVMKINIGIFDYAVANLPYFAFGTCFGTLSIKQKYMVKISIVVVCIHTVVVWAVESFIGDINIVVKIGLTVFGIVSSIALMNLCEKIELLKIITLFISKYSFPIYLLHTIFTSAVRIVLIHINIVSYLVHVVLGTIVGAALPIIVAVICAKLEWPEILFYPARTVKKLKSKHLHN